ncbi:alpha/beta hydrolase [[Clostridium] polysaccharolyticum]|uniref:Acetyl esterase/lipase n=1 Tax=[Clostridium] polysaccharolyticum TaxID=29364 RepID=A0A1H9ZFR2_9FIRM|nr:alpha/beta hydrolase [[Clostridium] polysaccharolyticum]SES80373.1 Acetyl esterase/lipase [[Clostridium] polysaccharolyticum]
MTYEQQKQFVNVLVENLSKIEAGVFIPSDWKPTDDFILERTTEGIVPVEHLIPKNKNGKVIYHLHGGGYIAPLLDLYREVAVQYSQIAGGAEVFSIDYRLAPTHKAPSALEDSLSVYKWILEQGYNPENIVFIGDSAGGNLVLTTMLYLRDNKLPLPKGAIIISPWACIETKAGSREENKYNDLILGINDKFIYDEVMASRYFKEENLKEPYVSPVYADYTGFPKLLIQSGSFEILKDDALMVAEAARKAGVDVTHTIYKGQSHDFQIFVPDLEETKAAWIEMKNFIQEVFDG